MATARLRRTFHYPVDSDSDDAVEEGMDEQDQDTLISSLAQRDNSTTAIYTQLLLVLPLAPIILYVPRLFALSTVISTVVTIISLIASAYTLYFLPLPPASHVPSPSHTTPSSRYSKAKAPSLSALSPATIFVSPLQSRPVPYLSSETTEFLRKYTIPANSAICAVLATVELLQGRSWSEGMMIGGGHVPGLVWVFILWTRRELRTLDLVELERLRYSTKAR